MYHHLARRWYRLRARRQSPPSAQAIFAPHGSLMLLHPQFFALEGTLASEVFMYHEEWYIGAQCRRLGLKVWYEPVVKAFHHEATSTGAIPMAQRCRWKREAIEMILRGL